MFFIQLYKDENTRWDENQWVGEIVLFVMSGKSQTFLIIYYWMSAIVSLKNSGFWMIFVFLCTDNLFAITIIQSLSTKIATLFYLLKNNVQTRTAVKCYLCNFSLIYINLTNNHSISTMIRQSWSSWMRKKYHSVLIKFITIIVLELANSFICDTYL